MIGLLRKDLYVADKINRILLIVAVVGCLVPGLENLGNTYALLLSYLIPFNSISYDERCRWDRYASMMPCRVGQIVGSKYVLGGIFLTLAEAIILAGAAVRSVIVPGSVNWPLTFQMCGVMAYSSAINIALMLPLSYRFGMVIGRIVRLVIIVGGIFVINNTIRMVFYEKSLPLVPVPVLAVAAAAAVVIVLFASFRLSVRFYKNRRNGLYS